MDERSTPAAEVAPAGTAPTIALWSKRQWPIPVVGQRGGELTRDLGPLVILAVILVVFFDRVLFTSSWVIPFDALNWHYPQQAFFVDQLAKGHFPLWNPLVYGGMPFAANIQAGAFYPINLVTMFLIAHLRGYLSYRAFELFEIAHVYLAGIGAYALARNLRLTRFASLCVAVMFMIGPYLSSQIEHVGLIESSAWVPWLALFARRAMATGSLRDAALAAMCWSFCFLAGFFATTVPVALGLGIYFSQAITRCLASRDKAPYPRPVVVSLVAGTLGAGLIAIQVFPTVELAGYSIATDRVFGNSPTPLFYLVTLLLPHFFNPLSFGAYWASSDITQSHFYVGFAPFLLVPFAFGAKRRIEAVIVAAVATGCAIVVLGTRTPTTALLEILLPSSISQGAYPFTFRLVQDLAVALLVGFGVEALQAVSVATPPGDAWRLAARAASVIAALLASIVVVVYVLLLLNVVAQPGKVPGTLTIPLDPIVSGAIVELLVVGWAYAAIRLLGAQPTGSIGRAVVLAALAVPLLLGNSNSPMNVREGNASTWREQLPPEVTLLRKTDVVGLSTGRWDRTDGSYQGQSGTMTQLWNLQYANGDDPFLLRDYKTFRESFAMVPQTGRMFSNADYRSHLIDLLGIHYVVTHDGDATAPTLADPQHWKPVFSSNSGTIYENQRPLPRAFVVPLARVVSPQLAMDTLRSGSFDPAGEVLLSSSSNRPTDTGATAGSAPRAATYHPTSTDSNVITVGAGPPGWLVVTDVNYPGWVARIDGQLVPVEQADYVFRAVYVDSVPHSVTFDFEPASVKRGLVVTGLAWLAVLAIVSWSWRRRQPRSEL